MVILSCNNDEKKDIKIVIQDMNQNSNSSVSNFQNFQHLEGKSN